MSNACAGNKEYCGGYTLGTVFGVPGRLAKKGGRLLFDIEHDFVYRKTHGQLAPELNNIGDYRRHHNDLRDDVALQLESQGYEVPRAADGRVQEASFSCPAGGRCRPDLIFRDKDTGKILGIIEIKTGNADLSIRQSEIFPFIGTGDAIPRGKIADDFGLDRDIPLNEQGFPHGIPIKIIGDE